MRVDGLQFFDYLKAHQDQLIIYKSGRMSVLVETSLGDITIDLQTDKYPTACYNFLKLCKLKHYNNALFIKVQKDFVTQVTTKKPTTIWKQMGENKPYFKDQIDMEAKVNALGMIGTSNNGSNMNNSEFFITLTKSHLSSLNGKHTMFGKVEQGFEVLKKINDTYVDEKNRPQMNIRILHTFVLDDPFEDPNNLKQPPSPKLEKDSSRLQAIQHLQMLQKYSTQSELLQATKKQRAKKQAVTLEMLGVLPDASVKPAENILFVCKLNPITQQRDLELIFSRYGPIKSVQIVRDWKTGQSLQYAFIEFQSEKSCEQAYLKMDNVVIDDRRIKVDFSQSVAKLIPKMKNNQVKTYKGGESKHKQKQFVNKLRSQKDYYGEKKYIIVAKDTNTRPKGQYSQAYQEGVRSAKNQRQDEQQNLNQMSSQSPEKQRDRKRKQSSSPRKQKQQKYRRRSKSSSRSRQRDKDKKQKKDKKSKKQKSKKNKQQKKRQRHSSESSDDSRPRSRQKHKKSKNKYDR